MAMACPRCKSELIDVQSQGSNLHFCGQCRGVWFDDREFLHHLRAKSGESELKWTSAASRSTNRICPHCGSDLKETPFNVCLSGACSRNEFLLIDFCDRCNGVWLDENELQKAEALSRDLPKMQGNITRALNEVRAENARHPAKNRIPVAAPLGAFVLLFSFLILYTQMTLQSHQGPRDSGQAAVCKSCFGTGKYKISCASCRGLGKISVNQRENVPCLQCGGTGHIAASSGMCGRCSGSGWMAASSISCERCRGTGRLPDSIKKTCAACYGTGHIMVSEVCGVCGGSKKSSLGSPLGCPGCNGAGTVLVKRTCPHCLAGIVETRVDSLCPSCGGRGGSPRKLPCDHCMGTGRADASPITGVCPRCSGSGFTALNGPNTIVCANCFGSGIGHEITCGACGGKGVARGS